MSSLQTGLHGDALLEVLTATAMEVQRARAVEDVLRAAGEGLERVGLVVAILAAEEGGVRVRYHSAGPALERLGELSLSGPLGLVPLRPDGPVLQSMREETPMLLPDFRARVARFLGAAPGVDAVLPALPDVGAVAPLHVRRSQWGAVLVLGDGLSAADLPALRLFSLQLGSAIEVAEAFEHLERRNVELELVHELAVGGAAADTRALCRRALATVCATTRSDVGTLHRFVADTREFVLVGDAYEYDGPLVEAFRRFQLPAEAPGATSPFFGPVAGLPVGASSLRDEGFAHAAIVPLAIEGRPAGLLTLARRADTPYLPPEIRSAEVLGVQMAALLERARLYDESSRLYADLKASYDQLARTQQELVRHERLAALGELAAVMAHEVRNPLGVIFNSLTTLKRLIHPEGDAEMLLNIVGEEADRLNRIVGDLLDFVRPYELDRTPVAVAPVLTGAVDAATQSSLHGNVRVVAELTQELPPFALDAHLLKQVLVNLIVNAAQAMPRGGTVTVRAKMLPRGGQAWLCVEVRDEGVGLTPRAAEKMFQPFFTTKATGTGLGLAVVKRIVDAHLGEVTAAPNETGPGTTFTVRFPPPPESRAGTGTPPQAPQASRR